MDKQLFQLFEDQAGRSPAAPAVVHESECWTYSCLARRADALAHRLRTRGVLPGARVGVRLERSAELVATMLAVFKVGAVYLPLDPAFPAQRLRTMLEDSQAELVIQREGSGSELQLVNTPGSHHVAAEEDQAAYIIYTSGSTGRPKGVEGTVPSLLNRLRWGWATFPFQAHDVCCQRTSICFVDSIAEILSPILGGAPLVVLSDSIARNPQLLVSALDQERVTRLTAVPSLLRALCDLPVELHETLTSLELIVSSGEALPTKLALALQHALPKVQLVNVYGSSEVGADVSYYVVPRPPRQGVFVPIGLPIANTTLHVMDQQQAPTEEGELYVGGVGLARGYVNDPQLTKNRFYSDVLVDGLRSRLYRTGDRVRKGVDGNLEYLGRLDHQVKLRGVRIELGEIEESLLSLQEVRSAVVVLREGPSGDQQLMAYVVPERTAAHAADALTLRAALGERLPTTMLPAHFVFMDELPCNVNGKVSGDLLPQPDWSSLPRRPYRAPSQILERELAEVWSKVLGLPPERIGLDDSFFDLGGHSFSLLRLIFQLSKRHRHSLDIERFSSQPTLAALTRSIGAGREGAKERAYAEGISELRLAPPQIRLLRGASIDSPQVRDHNMEFLLRVEAPRERVTTALVSVLARHDVFRIERICESQRGELMQTFGDKTRRLPEDWTMTCPDFAGFLFRAKGLRSALRPRDGELYRVVTFADTQGSTHIYCLINHLIFDAYSQRIFASELEALVRDEQATLPQPLSFRARTQYFLASAVRARLLEGLDHWAAQVAVDVDPNVFSEPRPQEQGSTATIWRRIHPDCNALAGLTPRTRSRAFLACCVHSAGELYDLPIVFTRIVASNRMQAPGLRDALTLGHVSDHYPQACEVRETAIATFASIERGEPADCGLSYPWLRNVFECAPLVLGAPVEEFPLYFNYIPRPAPADIISDQTHLLGDPAGREGEDYRGLGFLVEEGLGFVDVGIYSNTRHVPPANVEYLHKQVEQELLTLLNHLSQRPRASWS